MGVATLVFLIVKHRLECSPDERILGPKFMSRCELHGHHVLEAAFDLPGVIAVQINCANFKSELEVRLLI